MILTAVQNFNLQTTPVFKTSCIKHLACRAVSECENLQNLQSKFSSIIAANWAVERASGVSQTVPK